MLLNLRKCSQCGKMVQTKRVTDPDDDHVKLPYAECTECGWIWRLKNDSI
ncbi:unnamed protein product [marine sediment metagenome]|uniref:Uncharacterized protein n=1 Tax=marine sediment metagenome TaxID=412755 RepID=X1UKA1_9ZZZZ